MKNVKSVQCTLLAINIEIKPFLWYNNYRFIIIFDCLNYGNLPAQKGEKYGHLNWSDFQHSVSNYHFLYPDGDYPVRDWRHYMAPEANLLEGRRVLLHPP